MAIASCIAGSHQTPKIRQLILTQFLNWELIGHVAKKAAGEEGKALKEAHEEVEPEEDPHLYHNTGWTRELWIASLGLPAVLPPPEEEKDVKTAIGAARAKRGREDLL